MCKEKRTDRHVYIEKQQPLISEEESDIDEVNSDKESETNVSEDYGDLLVETSESEDAEAAPTPETNSESEMNKYDSDKMELLLVSDLESIF